MITHKRSFASFLFLVGCACVAWLLLGARHRAPVTAAQATSTAPATTATTDEYAFPIVTMDKPEKRSSDEAPIIDRVSVFPSTVCAGEEAIAEVSAHVPSGDDTSMHMVIGGMRGNRVPIVGKLTLDGAQRPLMAEVFAGNGEVTSVIVPLEVRSCSPARRAVVTDTLLANSHDEFEFTARVLDAPGQPLTRGQSAPLLAGSEIDHFRWEFGDGAKLESEEPTVRHSYSDRAQATRVSDFVVGVEAVLKSGGFVKGHTAVEVANEGREVLMDKGKVLIMTSLHPRFAEAHPDRSVTQTVRLFHVMPDDVVITSVRGRTVYSDERRDLGHATSMDVASVLGGTVIPPGHGLEVSLEIPAEDRAVAMVTYTVTGRAKDGTMAAGTFSIMRPAAPPTKETAVAVSDAKMVAKIQAARRILQKPYVTGEEIARLEREGKF
jgi:hypothetical protein